MKYEHIRFGEKIYQSPFTETSSVFEADIDTENVILKRRLSNMEREKDVLETLNNSHFPRLIGYLEQDSVHYLAIEKKPGIPLNQYIDMDKDWNSRKLMINESIGIVRRLAVALIALRDCTYYYRDFNLSHILLSDSGVSLVDHEADVKIDDDGSAVVDLETGTWETMAPEEFVVGSKMHESTTTYTLAVILHQLTHGRNLYRLESTDNMTVDERRVLARALHLEPLRPEDFEHSRSFFMQALNPNPIERMQRIEEFIANIEKL